MADNADPVLIAPYTAPAYAHHLCFYKVWSLLVAYQTADWNNTPQSAAAARRLARDLAVAQGQYRDLLPAESKPITAHKWGNAQTGQILGALKKPAAALARAACLHMHRNADDPLWFATLYRGNHLRCYPDSKQHDYGYGIKPRQFDLTQGQRDYLLSQAIGTLDMRQCCNCVDQIHRRRNIDRVDRETIIKSISTHAARLEAATQKQLLLFQR